MPVNLAILAPGLLGASVARAAHVRGLAEHISLWARRPEVRIQLESQDWCSQVAATAAEAVANADIVVLATPVERIIELLTQIAPSLKPGAIVTDVGSVKGAICRHGASVMPRGITFVGSHPMAGGAVTGWEHGKADLFEGRVCFVTPLADTPPAAVDTIARFWSDCGAIVATVDPDRHDEIVAQISHLPQVIATTLATHLATRGENLRHYSGNGLRDTTRIAASDATMWIEIFQQNRDEVLRAIRGYQDELQAMQAAIANGDWHEVRARLERGKAWRDGFRP